MPVLHETGYNKSRSDYHISDRLLLSVYIRCEITPTFLGGEEQISISGGSQSPI